MGKTLVTFAADTVTVNQVQHNYGNLVFIGVFFIVVLLVFVWWLLR